MVYYYNQMIEVGKSLCLEPSPSVEKYQDQSDTTLQALQSISDLRVQMAINQLNESVWELLDERDEAKGS
jgi:hypothetical protein